MSRTWLALWLVVSAVLNFHIFFKPKYGTKTVVAKVQNTVLASVKTTVVAEAKTKVVEEAKTKVVEEAIVIGRHTVLHMPLLPLHAHSRKTPAKISEGNAAAQRRSGAAAHTCKTPAKISEGNAV
jgi:hypothetical protein